jgi:hypothetical protein
MLSHKKNTFKVFGKAAALLAVLVIGLLGSCQNALDSELSPGVAGTQSLSVLPVNPQTWPMGNVAGNWYSDEYGETFDIDNITLIYGYDMGSGFFQVYEGNIVRATNTSASTGYIYIQYTDPLDPDWKGNYYAVYWSYFGTPYDTIRLSGCSDGMGKPTLREAIVEYTYENGYFNGYSDFERVTAEYAKAAPSLSGKPPMVLLLEQQAGITSKAE